MEEKKIGGGGQTGLDDWGVLGPGSGPGGPEQGTAHGKRNSDCD